ncbi:MAG: hypothetical protein ACM3X9_10630 [Bacillota bacterium]
MKFFDKNNWLNLIITLTGFYSVFSIMQIIMGRFGARVVAATPAASHLTGNYYWLVSFAVALILALVLAICFCKPRTPLFVFIGVLLGGVLGLYYPLYTAIINLDHSFRTEGLAATYKLLPHLVVLVGALIALYFAWLSNKLSKTE